MNKKWKSILLSQDGKIEAVFTTALIVALIGVIVGKYTGTKVFVFKLSSGIIRLAIGLLSALYLYLWWGMKLYEVFSFGEFGGSVMAYLLAACLVMAFLLIPLGIIQIVGTIIKTNERHTVERRGEYKSRRGIYVLIQFIGFVLLFQLVYESLIGAIIGLILLVFGGVLYRKEIKKTKEEKKIE